MVTVELRLRGRSLCSSSRTENEVPGGDGAWLALVVWGWGRAGGARVTRAPESVFAPEVGGGGGEGDREGSCRALRLPGQTGSLGRASSRSVWQCWFGEPPRVASGCLRNKNVGFLRRHCFLPCQLSLCANKP